MAKLNFRRIHALFLVALIAPYGCEQRGFENQVDPHEFLPQLATATSVEEQIALLEALSGVQPASPAERAALWTPEIRALLTASDSMVVAKAGELLAGWGDFSATSALTGLLRDSDPMLRMSAALSLAALADPAAAGALLTATGDGEAMVRAMACAALGKIGTRVPDREILIAALRVRLKDPDGVVRAAASLALGSVGSPGDLPTLLGLLEDPDSGVVSAATTTLGMLGERRAVPAFATLLREGGQAARLEAAKALGYIGGRDAVAPLVEALKGDDGGLRLVALKSLGLLGDPAAIHAIMELARDTDTALAFHLPMALARVYRPENYQLLIAGLQDGVPLVRAAVCTCFGLAGERRATAELVRSLGDPEANVRQAAAEALGLLGDPEGMQPLRRLLARETDEDVRSLAWGATIRLMLPIP